MEVPYVFANLPRGQGYDQTDDLLSDRIMTYWTRFAATGNPNGDGVPDWPRYSPETDASVELI